MITLLIDTSSKDVSIAIYNNHKILSSITKSIPNEHSVYTVSFIEKVIAEAKITPKEIERIMVVVGPGSFTGLRIGVTIAKVYAYIQNIEIIPISSLKMRALSITHNNCLSIIDAHHNNYYIGLYNKKNQEIIEEQFATKEKVLEIIKKYQPTIVSDEKGTIENISYPKQELNIIRIIEAYQNETPRNPHLVNPNYLKLPQALEKKHD